MENASKALIIAGGVLIAILILTLFSYLFTQMSGSTSGIYQTMQKHEISEFNQKFLNFEGRGINSGTTPLTVQDVATLINLAQDSKNNYKIRTSVQIILNGTNIADTQVASQWLKNNVNSTIKYKCVEVHTNTSTLLVDKVEIAQI